MINAHEHYDLWFEFIDELQHKNRFFCNHKILELLKNIIDMSQLDLPKDQKLYRARIYTDDVSLYKKYNDFSILLKKLDPSTTKELTKVEELQLAYEKYLIEDKKTSGFWGYNIDNSFVPLDEKVIKNGRANPNRIKYLYVAESELIATAEVRGKIGDYISIAEIIILEELRIIDFSYNIINLVDSDNQFLAYLIYDEFRKPNNGDEFSYLPTQFISEFVKSLGFDGIKFNSSLYKNGCNYAIFNYEKCVAQKSALFEVQDVCHELKCIGPFLGDRIVHHKLRPYLDIEQERIKKIIMGIT